MNKIQLSEVFRSRLLLLSQRSGLNLSKLALGIGVDRSALSQMLTGQTLRLPRAETLIRIAKHHQVSLDWLLGLSEDEAITSSLTPAFEIERASANGNDPLLARWHFEATGTKIRYIPTALPDLLRTEEIIAFDSRRTGNLLETEMSETQFRIEYNRQSETDMEVAMPLQTLEQFAKGENIWKELDQHVRNRQLQHMMKLADELYPTFRLFLFDGGRNFSAPFTVFGPRRAAVYLGDSYLVLNSKDAIASLAKRFDHLVRQAVVHAHETPLYFKDLASRFCS